MSEQSQEAFDGVDAEGVKTAAGFAGHTFTRDQPLRIGDEMYLLVKCEVVTDGRSRKKDDDGNYAFKAGLSVAVLAELDARSAGQVALDHG
jgi:hypothetical protein